jgi:hypothetical protein
MEASMPTSSPLTVAEICARYRARFKEAHGSSTTDAQWSALNALMGCHTEQYGTLNLTCQDCAGTQCRYRSCGHRFCNQCQQHQTLSWTERQTRKLLPVEYYLVTFTLPFELRRLAKAHSEIVYPILIRVAADVLRRFGRNHQKLNAELGLTYVLHTHTRELNYHPHVHIAVPGGGVNVARKEWRALAGKYLFNGRALGQVFRGALLHALSNAGLSLPKTPDKWVAHCERVGRGNQVFEYLARYLYRGVIANRNLLHDDGENVTFRYQDAETKRWKTRTLQGEDFIALLLQHVLPKGLRRTRDFGFLHGNAQRLLQLVQYVLRASMPLKTPIEKARFVCPHCRGTMRVMNMTPPIKPG